MQKLVTMRERNYADAEKYDYAPFNFEDAMDSYEKVLEIAGEISGEIVAANAERVDHEGPYSPPLQRFELLTCSLYHGCRYGESCRCRFC